MKGVLTYSLWIMVNSIDGLRIVDEMRVTYCNVLRTGQDATRHCGGGGGNSKLELEGIAAIILARNTAMSLQLSKTIMLRPGVVYPYHPVLYLTWMMSKILASGVTVGTITANRLYWDCPKRRYTNRITCRGRESGVADQKLRRPLITSL